MLDRLTMQFPKGEDGGFVDTGEYDEVQEAHIRETAAALSKYADEFYGDPGIYDPTGRYLCGGFRQDEPASCNKYRPGSADQYDSGKCVIFDGDISGNLGTCDFWERYKGLIDPELQLAMPFPRDRRYVEYPDGEGAGCQRCFWGSGLAIRPDSQGRNLFCRWYGMRVTPTACCAENDRLPKVVFENNQRVELYKISGAVGSGALWLK